LIYRNEHSNKGQQLASGLKISKGCWPRDESLPAKISRDGERIFVPNCV
jgi:hypothetical protein